MPRTVPFTSPSAGKQGRGDTLDRPRVPEGADPSKSDSSLCGETTITLKSRNPAHKNYISTKTRPQSQPGRPADAQLFTITDHTLLPVKAVTSMEKSTYSSTKLGIVNRLFTLI